MNPSELLVFVGAGVSMSSPSCLPSFNTLRSVILKSCYLDEYVWTDSTAGSPAVDVAEALVPEPFLNAVAEGAGRSALTAWLRNTLQSVPNTAHTVLAELALQGARVWTVNFDELIEAASKAILNVTSWPDTFDAAAQIAKPHGTLNGSMTATSRDVLAGLRNDWHDGLADAVAGRTVVFLGYSGRDLYFAPIWDQVLEHATEILWFDFNDGTASAGRDIAYKRALLRNATTNGKLVFPMNMTVPPNPSIDFVTWCMNERLIGPIDPTALNGAVHVNVPALTEANRLGMRAAVQQVLGDTSGAMRTVLAQTVQGPDRRKAAREYVAMNFNHGSTPARVVLEAASIVTGHSRFGKRFVPTLMSKRINISFNQADHDAVLRLTRGLQDDPSVADRWVLRAGSLRYRGSIPESLDVARHALELAVLLQHQVVVANACLQLGLSLAWNDQLDELAIHLNDRLFPYASLASNRWVAWAEIVAAIMHVRQGHHDKMATSLDRARTTVWSGRPRRRDPNLRFDRTHRTPTAEGPSRVRVHTSTIQCTRPAPSPRESPTKLRHLTRHHLGH